MKLQFRNDESDGCRYPLYSFDTFMQWLRVLEELYEKDNDIKNKMDDGTLSFSSACAKLKKKDAKSKTRTLEVRHADVLKRKLAATENACNEKEQKMKTLRGSIRSLRDDIEELRSENKRLRLEKTWG